MAGVLEQESVGMMLYLCDVCVGEALEVPVAGGCACRQPDRLIMSLMGYPGCKAGLTAGLQLAPSCTHCSCLLGVHSVA